ncbi:MAG: SDR family NAD(P)-dependent oxidoreductase [Steroidobacteraceae bacterium]|nr:SDR family NAD(P)-dependent oxidoreductase [Steroidobacteraceae bacterium]
MHFTRTVLITGASSGIGAALARECARRGFRVALVARRIETLETLAARLREAGSQASAHAGDVTRDGDIARVVAELATQGVVPDIVIANAGFGVVGPAQKLELDDYRRQFETNLFGVLRTFYDTLGVLKQTRGRFAVMGSIAGHLSGPGGSAYAMSKFAVRAFAEALHGDLKGTGVGVTLISPGFVESDIRRVDNRGGLHSHVEDPVPPWLRMNADKAARVMMNGILRGRREVFVTFHGKVIVFFARHFPRLVRYLLVRSNRGARPEPQRS